MTRVARIALAVAALLVVVASLLLWWLIISDLGWFALGVAGAGLAALAAIANLVNYGSVLPPANTPDPWWR